MCNCHPLDQNALQIFDDLLGGGANRGIVGPGSSTKNVGQWAASLVDIDPNINTYNIPNGQVSRADLRGMWGILGIQNGVCIEACVLSTLGWGGMNIKNARSAWLNRNNWIGICNQIRAGELSGRAGYANFIQARLTGQMPGMGVAFFTKILFFACSQENAYILDQWTGCSVHVLTGQRDWPEVTRGALNPINGRRSATISDAVTADDYIHFCEFIDSLAGSLNVSSHRVEEHMFSRGGGNNRAFPWRQHVRNTVNP